jgi:hypothetical protein
MRRTVPDARRFCRLPEILIFMMPEVIYRPIIRLYSETKVIRFPPGFQDGTNLDLVLVNEKGDEPFVCPVARQASDSGVIP